MDKPNLIYVKELADGDTDFEMKLISVLVREFPIEKELFYQYLENRDYKKLAEIVHKIKHKISFLSMEESAIIVNNFEKELRQNKTESLSKFEEILMKISVFLEELK